MGNPISGNTDNSDPDEVPGVLGKSTKYNGVLGVSTANGQAGVAGVNETCCIDFTTGDKLSGNGLFGRGTGNGVFGIHVGADGAGVVGTSDKNDGVRGFSAARDHSGVVGTNTGGGVGVLGQSTQGPGVVGNSEKSRGIQGHSNNEHGVFGESTQGAGVVGISKNWNGVYGETESTRGGVGVWGEHKSNGIGVVGKSNTFVGVWGVSETNEGIHGETKSPNVAAIAGFNSNGVAIYAETSSPNKAGIFSIIRNPDGTGAAIHGRMDGEAGLAGLFEGNVHVTRKLTVREDIILQNADCAEDFDIVDADLVEPGTVMVLGEEGALLPSYNAYDKRVAGVVSGAGNYKPGIVLDKQQSQSNRMSIALLGKVYCKVDAQYGAIEVGDLLTTSPTPGHAMKTDDPMKALGAMIGKALRSLSEGQGLIPILIALQ